VVALGWTADFVDYFVDFLVAACVDPDRVLDYVGSFAVYVD